MDLQTSLLGVSILDIDCGRELSTIIAIRPVIPDPGARLVWHVCRMLLLQDAIKVECCEVFRPVYTIFVDRGDIGRRWPGGLGSSAARYEGLVVVPDWDPAACGRFLANVVGHRVWVGEIFYIALLRIVFVEEDTSGSSLDEPRHTRGASLP